MPFSKRKLTWNEEVLAGLIVLVIIIAGITLWLWMQRDSFASLKQESQSGTVLNASDYIQ